MNEPRQHRPLTGDVLRTSEPAARAVSDLTARGFTVGRVDASQRTEFLAAIGKALGFPAYYGQNLDALWDCLTDLTVPTALVWSGWEEFAVSSPGDWAAVMGVLRDRARVAPAFTVVLCAADASGSGSAAL